MTPLRLVTMLVLITAGCIQPPPSGTSLPDDDAGETSDDGPAEDDGESASDGGVDKPDLGGGDAGAMTSDATSNDAAGPDVTIDGGDTGADDADVAPIVETVEFRNGPNYDGTTDTELIQGAPTTNYADDVDMEVKGGAGQHVVIRWDISAIPTDAVVEDAYIVLTSTANASGSEHDVHAVNVEWSETEATWNERLAGVGWTESGCQDEADRSPKVLGTFAAPGPNTVMQIGPNSDLIGTVQSWVNAPDTNHGVVLQRPGAGDGLHLHSCEAAEAAVRPTLHVQFHRMP